MSALHHILESKRKGTLVLSSLTRRKLGKRLVDIRSLLDRLDAFMLSVNGVRTVCMSWNASTNVYPCPLLL